MKRLARKKKLNFTLFTGIENKENGYHGAKLSHCAVIKRALKEKCKQVLILEDDIKYLNNFNTLNKPPDNWDILYLGGEIIKKV